ncbi:hypothetical protein [Acinetobacter sp. NBRC 100985]|uniref:hypothetical protein n=1 Tax=Acinetobacter sp. NBRC 100985 TaxID=1071390 RepID=UPI00207A636A|nr:hypothetical protein [Acinetobacter sp. NBRC 100985]
MSITKKMIFDSGFKVQEFKSFSYDLRNKIRAIIFSDKEASVVLLNKLRAKLKIKDLVEVENFLRNVNLKTKEPLLSSLYPSEPQTYNNFIRLKNINLKDSLDYIEILLKKEKVKIYKFLKDIEDLNELIFSNNEERYSKLEGILKNYGYSYFILRKAVAIKILDGGGNDEIVDEIINKSGFKNSNLVVNTLFQCYQFEQDYISLKKAILNFPDKKNENKYLRDIIRVPFHPYAVDDEDFSELIQSNLQFSLIDALFIIFLNKDKVGSNYKNIFDFFEYLDKKFSDDKKIINYYLISSDLNFIEDTFFQQSSAWCEYGFIKKYRKLIDFFYDDPDAKYIKITSDVVDDLRGEINITSLNELADSNNFKSHNYEDLKKIENYGIITRTALFNFCLYLNNGDECLQDENLYKLMGSTRDLARTITIDNIRQLAKFTDSIDAKIIYYLLISRKSKNEREDFLLRRLIQKVVKDRYSGSLLDYIKYIHEKNDSIALYIYETCTEDFIAKLSHIITTISQVTETRSVLHQWMGEVTGEKSYLDRARTILIDQQISRVRDELDDHRIYVDVAKFVEWINDVLMREINTILGGITYNLQDENTEIPLLYNVVEKAFFEFTNNNIFGIASYLGRRIRHGTFKGHLISIVKNIENDYEDFLSDPIINSKWNTWVESFDKNINLIIRNNLHIESQNKRDGLLKPALTGNEKQEIAIACTKDILRDYSENNSLGTIPILIDYCWRLIEVDLRQINSFLNHRKQILIQTELLGEIKDLSNNSMISKEFIRDVQHLVSDKINMMSMWFKRPQSVAPKASLSLLYKAVVAEVRDSFPHFSPELEFGDKEIELMGGAYHVLYDAFYVVIYNAAKHGKENGIVTRSFNVIKHNLRPHVNIIITSETKDGHSDDYVNSRLKVLSSDDILNAQLREDRSGIKKLHNLQANDDNFIINRIYCENKVVTVDISYTLVHA